MPEMLIPGWGSLNGPLLNHLWQSTLLVGVAGLLSLLLNRNHARLRYWIWLIASLKFLVPFSVLVAMGSTLGGRLLPSLASSPTPAVWAQVTQPFENAANLRIAPLDINAAHVPPRPPFPIANVLTAVWMAGSALIVSRWVKRWREVHSVIRRATPLTEGREFDALTRIRQSAGVTGQVRLVSSDSTLEPGVFGLFRPVLALPAGIGARLDDAQLDAVLTHELCHIARRDNLFAAVHMAVEAGFWFHPLVWWLGTRLVQERERACDEEVLRLGSEPETYAEGILAVCRFYVESPLECVSGITGAGLKRRIEEIMNGQSAKQLGIVQWTVLAVAALAAMLGPVGIGMLHPTPGRAQATTDTAPAGRPVFEVASIKPSGPDDRRVMITFAPGGRLNTHGTTLKALIRAAYNFQDFQIVGFPSALTERYDIAATPDKPSGDPRKMTEEQRKAFREELMARLQVLLEDRFKLKFHKETKELPMYALVVAKGGIKMKEAAPEDTSGPPKQRGLRADRGELQGMGAEVSFLARHLSSELGRTVTDMTGLKGNFDFKLKWAPDPNQPAPPGLPQEKEAAADVSGPSLFTALQEQLGLKLESRKGPVEIMVIEHAEKPSEN